MWAFLLAVCGGTAGLTPEDPAAVIEGLIRSTRQLAGFHARYVLSQPDEADASVEIWYEAPDRMRVDMRGGEGSEVSSWWMVDGRLGFLLGSSEGAQHGMIRMEDLLLARTYELLEEYFPGTIEDHLDPGPALHWSWSFNTESDRVEFEIAAVWRFGERRTAMGWFSSLLADPDLLRIEGDTLVQEHPRFRAALSLSTGFLTELVRRRPDGATSAFRLAHLELEPDLEAGVFRVPARPKGARDLTDGLRVMLAPPPVVRRTCLMRIDRNVEEGLVAWDYSSQEDAKTVLQELYSTASREAFERARERLTEGFPEMRAYFSSRKEAGASLDQLREELERVRQALRARLDKDETHWGQQIVRQDVGDGRSSCWTELLEIEKGVLQAVFDEHMRRPVLDELESTVSDVLDS